MATSQLCSERDKVWPEMHPCWPWQNAIGRFVSTLGSGVTGGLSQRVQNAAEGGPFANTLKKIKK